MPRNDGGEADTVLAFLAFARNCVIKKTGGLSDEQLRRAMVPSGTSLLGLVWHLAEGERYWFGYHVAGQGVDDYEFSMAVPAETTAVDVLRSYRDAITASDEILGGVASLDQRIAVPTDDGRQHTVRWVLGT